MLLKYNVWKDRPASNFDADGVAEKDVVVEEDGVTEAHNGVVEDGVACHGRGAWYRRGG